MRWLGECFAGELTNVVLPACDGNLRLFTKFASKQRNSNRSTFGQSYAEPFLTEIRVPSMKSQSADEIADLFEDNKNLQIVDLPLRNSSRVLQLLVDNSATTLTRLRINGDRSWVQYLGHEMLVELCTKCTHLQELVIGDNFNVKSDQNIQWPYPVSFALTLKQLHCHSGIGKGFINHMLLNCSGLEDFTVCGTDDIDEYVKICEYIDHSRICSVHLESCENVAQFHDLCHHWTELKHCEFSIANVTHQRVVMECISVLAQTCTTNLRTLKVKDAIVSAHLLSVVAEHASRLECIAFKKFLPGGNGGALPATVAAIEISDCGTELDDAAFKALIEHCGALLRKLKLLNATALTSETMVMLAESAASLRSVEMVGATVSTESAKLVLCRCLLLDELVLEPKIPFEVFRQHPWVHTNQ
eukprot:TRINITY_DN48998_c0_g1_i2.p1 TRINITY_DN48998_c0_g1~~TRINITY_DN48998_c0_g1_i2.p1  ORF type:complete len:416 (-),score=5.23 TRINITY_DN48998_c0_g1_i2:44-1291(-)